MPPAAAVASLREACAAASTKTVYRAAEPLYEASCAAGDMQPWPPCEDSLELFAGSLWESGAFAAPAVYFTAIVESVRARGQHLPLATSWCDGVGQNSTS